MTSRTPGFVTCPQPKDLLAEPVLPVLPVLPEPQQGWALAEMHHARLWDARCNKSLAHICQDLQRQPGVAFSRVCGNRRKAAHRIFSEETTTAQGLLAGHIQQSAMRSQGLPLLLAASDTTSFNYTSQSARRGMGPISTSLSTRGFLTHSVMALTPDGVPLGVLHQSSWVRDPEDFGQSNQRKKRQALDKESYKWTEALQGVEAALDPEQLVLILQDREADIFAFLQEPRRSQTHLLVRAAQPRRVQVLPFEEPAAEEEPVAEEEPAAEQNASAQKLPEPISLFVAVQQAPVIAHKVFAVKAKNQGAAPAWREAHLSVRCCKVQVLPPDHHKVKVPLPVVWVIRASEESPPPGEEPIEWVLLSTLPVHTPQDALDRVDNYTKRWLIERFHFVLKSGLGIERLQLEEAASVQKALSIYSIVAWRLLYLMYLSRQAPLTPAAQLFEPVEIQVLSAQAKTQVQTLAQAMPLIAKIGGFKAVPSAPRAGVKSLWLGLRRLDAMVEGWKLAISATRPKDTGQD